MNICRSVNIGKQSRAAALGLLIYEHIITIEDEIDLIWLKKKSWVTCLYHFNRWLPAVWLTFDMIQQNPYNAISSKTYVRVTKTPIRLTSSGLVASPT
ncbi:hypothetical protein BDR06DRAFT_456708 [Suillus hirtellus]|nr:hypothetical protein BDR06DRAFT_456708 [Suillus hirtellus]